MSRMWTQDNNFLFLFLNFNIVFSNSAPEKFANIWWIEQVEISMVKFEVVYINSLFKWHFHSLRCYLSSLFLTRKRMNLLSLEYTAVPSEKLPFNPHVPCCSLIELFTLYILRGTLSSGWIWLNCMTWLHYLVLHAFLCRCVIFLSVMRTKGVVFFFS